MTHNKGSFFWEQIVNRFEDKTMTNEDFSYCDSLEKKVKTESDKRILNYFNMLIENEEQKEKYFRQAMMTYVNEVYKGHTDGEIIKGS